MHPFTRLTPWQPHSQRHRLSLLGPRSLHRGGSSDPVGPCLTPCTPTHSQTRFPNGNPRISIAEYQMSHIHKQAKLIPPMRDSEQSRPWSFTLSKSKHTKASPAIKSCHVSQRPSPGCATGPCALCCTKGASSQPLVSGSHPQLNLSAFLKSKNVQIS